MNTTVILILGIVFILVGLLFCALSFVIKAQSDNDSKKALLGKVGGTVFFIIGFITIVVGICGVAFHKEATRTAIQTVALAYTFILMVIMFIFTLMIGKKGKK